MSYPGGKAGAGVYQKLISMMPPHRVFISAFLGECAVLRFKRPAQKSIGLDLDPNAVESFKREHAANIPRLELRCADALSWLKSYPFQGDELLYLDPPYPLDARKSQRPIYRYELDAMQHTILLDLIQTLPTNVMISSYPNEQYDRALSTWRRETFQTTNRAGNSVTECVYLNFEQPNELHDYSHIGDDYRGRERIRRRQRRWVRMLRELPVLERRAMLDVLSEAFE